MQNEIFSGKMNTNAREALPPVTTTFDRVGQLRNSTPANFFRAQLAVSALALIAMVMDPACLAPAQSMHPRLAPRLQDASSPSGSVRHLIASTRPASSLR